MDGGIEFEVEGEIAFLTINRPKVRNALDLASAAELAGHIKSVEASEEIQAAVLTGAGGYFCAGADLREVAVKGAVYGAWAGTDGPLARPCTKPVVAAVEGHAVAGGLGMALWADLRVASESAVFGVFCRRFGVPMSDGTPTRLPRLVGQSRALDMLLTGRPVNAREALAIGLADRVVPEGGAREAAAALVREIASFPPLAMRADRAAAWDSWDDDVATRLVAESEGAAEAKKIEAEAGAARFNEGAGRGGEFSR